MKLNAGHFAIILLFICVRPFLFQHSKSLLYRAISNKQSVRRFQVFAKGKKTDFVFGRGIHLHNIVCAFEDTPVSGQREGERECGVELFVPHRHARPRRSGMRSPPTDADVKFNQNQRDKVYRSVKADAPGFRRIPCGRKMFRGARWIDRGRPYHGARALGMVVGVSAPVPRGRFGSCSLRSLSVRGERPRRFITSEGDHGAFRDRMNHYGRAKSRLRDSAAQLFPAYHLISYPARSHGDFPAISREVSFVTGEGERARASALRRRNI